MEFCLPAFSNAELAESLARHLLDDDDASFGCYAVSIAALETEDEEEEVLSGDRVEERSSVLQDRELAAGEVAADAPESPRPRTAPRPPSSPNRRRWPPSARPATASAAASATASSLYGSAQVPDIRISRDPVAAYRESLQVSLRAFRRRQWRPLDVEALASTRDPEDVDRRNCSLAGGGGGGSRPVSATGSSARFPAPRRRPKSVPAEALNSRAAAAAAAANDSETAVEEGKDAGAGDPNVGQLPSAAALAVSAAAASSAEADEEADTASPQAALDGDEGDCSNASEAPQPTPPPLQEELPPLRLEDCAPAFTPRFFEWQGGVQEGEAAATSVAASTKRRRSGDTACSSSSDEDNDSGDSGDSSGSSSDCGDRSRAIASQLTESPKATSVVEKRRQRRWAPQLNLPPERDPQYLLPSSCLEPDRIEFSARLVRDLPRFEFGPALPEPFAKASFRSLADCETGWRGVFPEELAPEPSLAGLMDRLIAMERMQLDTVRMEGGSRAAQLRRAAASTAAAAAAAAAAATAGVYAMEQRPVRVASGRPRSRNCCRGCLQVACAGDCPLKRAPSARVCLHCRQPLCLGRACLRRTYDERARGEPVESPVPPPQQQQQKQPALLPLKFCKPCATVNQSHARRQQQQPQQQQQVALLSRPRSQLPTYSSSAQNRHRSAEAKRRQSGRLPTAVNFSEQFKEATGAGQVADVTRDQNCFRPYNGSPGGGGGGGGRNSLLLGKSRSSMRRNSLTARRAWSANAM